MSLYKRNEIWWIKIYLPNGERIQRSTKTKIKKEAREFHDKIKAESWRVNELGEKEKHLWQDAVIRWLKEQSHKRSIEDDKRLLCWLDAHLKNVYLNEIDRNMVVNIIEKRQQEGVKNATVNRTIAVLRSILNRAAGEWDLIDSAPYIKSLPEEKIRIRWLSHDEANKLLHELPNHLKAMMRFTLATGLRESNVVNLQWDQIDIKRKRAWIHADQAKGKKDMAVPLNDEALNIIRDQIGKNIKYVFTYKAKNVTGCNNHAWRKALKRAGIENFRWHDLRHTWASWHVQSGTPLNVLQELGGWSDYKMVLRYAHLSADHLATYAGNVSYNSATSENIVKLKTP